MRRAATDWARAGRRVGLAAMVGALVVPSIMLVPAVSNAVAESPATQSPAVADREPAVAAREPAVAAREPAVADREPAVAAREPAPIAPLPAVLADPSAASPGAAGAAVKAADDAGAGEIWLGTAVFDRLTGELVVGASGAEPVYAASLAKLVVVIDILDRRRAEGLEVTESDVRLIGRALGPSDDGAMSALWGRFDGVGAAERLSARVGLTATTPPRRDPSQWGEMMISAADAVALYRYLLVMPQADRDIVLGSLAGLPPVRGTDGFDQAYGLLGAGTELPAPMAKQAWMCCFGQQYSLHSAGLVGERYVIALLSEQPRADGWSDAAEQLTLAAAAAGRELA